MKIAQNITELIGNTPIVRLDSLSKKHGANIFAKCEFMNPNSSIKDRISYAMIKQGLDSGKITKDTTIIEATSGNTGIGIAGVCAALGIKLIIVMPSSMSIERRRLIQSFGATLELSAPEKGMNGAIARANELLESTKNSYMLKQFDNEANPNAHKQTTAKEILQSFEGQDLHAFVAGVGTGGCISGVGEILKQHYKGIKVIALEPSSSKVLQGEAPTGPHKIQGIGAGFIPNTLNTKIYDEILSIENEEAFDMARFLAKNEGILAGISSGANLVGACKIAKQFQGKNILTILNDTGERYLSTDLFN